MVPALIGVGATVAGTMLADSVINRLFSSEGADESASTSSILGTILQRRMLAAQTESVERQAFNAELAGAESILPGVLEYQSGRVAAQDISQQVAELTSDAYNDISMFALQSTPSAVELMAQLKGL